MVSMVKTVLMVTNGKDGERGPPGPSNVTGNIYTVTDATPGTCTGNNCTATSAVNCDTGDTALSGSYTTLNSPRTTIFLSVGGGPTTPPTGWTTTIASNSGSGTNSVTTTVVCFENEP